MKEKKKSNNYSLHQAVTNNRSASPFHTTALPPPHHALIGSYTHRSMYGLGEKQRLHIRRSCNIDRLKGMKGVCIKKKKESRVWQQRSSLCDAGRRRRDKVNYVVNVFFGSFFVSLRARVSYRIHIELRCICIEAKAC